MKDVDKTKEQLIGELKALRMDNTQLASSLDELEEKYSAFYENSPIPMLLTSKDDGKVLDANKSAVSLSGYSSKEELLEEFVPGEQYSDLNRRKEVINTLKIKGEIHKQEHEFIRKDGTPIWVECYARSYPDKGWVASTMVDITERRQVEDKLREREQRFDLAVSGSSDGLWDWPDVNSDKTWWSPIVFELLGYKDGEIKASFSNFKSLLHPDDVERVSTLIREHFEKRVPFDTEYRFRTKSGKYRWFRSRAQTLRDENGKPIRMSGAIQDIDERKNLERALKESHDLLEKKVAERTAKLKAVNKQLKQEINERKQIEEELKKTRDYLENIIESSLDSIEVSDSAAKINKVNKAFLELLGFKEGELIGKYAYDFAPAEVGTYESTTGSLIEIDEKYFNDAKTMVERLFEEGKIENRESYFVRKDKIMVPVENNIALLYNTEGDVIGGVGIIRDITERRKAQEKIIEYQNKLKSLTSQLTLVEEKERRHFADYLHDQIGQKLFISKLKLEMLKKSLSSTDNTRTLSEILELILQMIKDIRSLTFDLSPPILYQLGLGAALEWITEQISEQYGIMVTFEDDGQEKALADDTKVLLFQAVRELLSNVAKHAQTDNAKVSMQSDNVHIRICVEDNGVGFAPLNRTSPLNCKGGFGLFSIGERLDHLGGQFKIESRPGHGTKAIILAPLKD